MTGRAVKLVPLAVALLAAGWALRLGAGGTPPESPGVSYLAYRLPAGESIVFPVAPEDHDLALTVHLEVPQRRAGPAVLRFVVAATLTDEDGGAVWRGRALLSALPGGAIADSVIPLTDGRVLRLPAPPGDRARRLTVTLEPGHDAAGGGIAAVRLQRRAPRSVLWPALGSGADQATRRLGGLVSPFGWPYVDVGALAELRREPTRRRFALSKGGEDDLVHVTTLRRTPGELLPEAPGGEEVTPRQGAAWTVRGPGAVRLRLEAMSDLADVDATVRTIDHRGATSERTVRVGGTAAELSLPAPPDGAVTVEVTCDTEPGVRAHAFVAEGARQLGDLPAGEGGEIRPDRRRVPLWRVQPGSPPLRATLAGDGVVRLVVRPVTGEVEPGGVAGAPPRFAWRLVGRGGEVTGHGDAGVRVTPSGFETWRGSPWLSDRAPGALLEPEQLVPGEPVVFVAAGEPGSVLELEALEAPLDVSLEAADTLAPDDAPYPTPRVAAAYELPLAGARLRYAPWVRRRWAPFRPDNHAELAAAGALVELEAQVRLEPAGPGGPPAGPWRALDPFAPRVRHQLVERTDPPRRWRAFHRTVFATGEGALVHVAADGPTAGRLVLDHHFGAEALGGRMTVFVDGLPATARRITSTRGRVRLRQLPPGAHEVRVVGPPGTIMTTAPSVEGGGAARSWAERTVWRLARGEEGTLTVSLRLAEGEAKTLNVVVYADAPLTGFTVRAEIDDGRRGPALHHTGGRTRLDRIVTVPAERAQTVWLDQEGGARARAVVPVRLGPDLGPGTHKVRITLLEGPARAHARFFVTGASGDAVRPASAVEWEAD